MIPDLVMLQAAQEGERPIRTEAEARGFLDEFAAVMATLVAIVEEETALVRAGKLFDATDVATRKSAELGRYLQIRTRLKREFPTVSRLVPDVLARMRDDHLTAIEKIRTNLGVLAIAREVAEGIVRNVSASVGRASAPSTYGRNAAPPPSQRLAARGIAVDRRS
jgi:hypothetical protein